MPRTRVLARAAQGGAKDLDRLGARDTVGPVEHEERHTGDAERPRLENVLLDIARILVALQDTPRLIGRHADLRRESHERLAVVERLRLHELCAAAAGASPAEPMRGSEMCQPMGVERVDHRGALEVVVQAVLRREHAQLVGHGAGLLDRAARFLGEHLQDRAPDAIGKRRVELEAAPQHLDILGCSSSASALSRRRLPM